MLPVFVKMFLAYGLTAIVSIAVAVFIKLMTTVLSNVRRQRVSLKKIEEVGLLAPTAIVDDKTSIAVIAAAIHAAVGSQARILRIKEETGRSSSLWITSGRLMMRQVTRNARG